MALYQGIEGIGKKMLMVGGLVALLGSPDNTYGHGSYLYQLSGIVSAEEKGEVWYQVSLKDPSMMFVLDRDIVKVRFHSTMFDTKELDQRIKLGTKLTVTVEEVLGRNKDYDLMAVGVDKIE